MLRQFSLDDFHESNHIRHRLLTSLGVLLPKGICNSVACPVSSSKVASVGYYGFGTPVVNGGLKAHKNGF